MIRFFLFFASSRGFALSLLLFFASSCGVSEESKKKNETGSKKICLNMIVKDESKVIERCLGSVKGLIDYWVIVDTGSTDGTQKVIAEFMKDIPGELHERPWVNFEHNRNEALALTKGKGDYLLFIDADEQLIFNDDFRMPALDVDLYFVPIRERASYVLRSLLVNNHLDQYRPTRIEPLARIAAHYFKEGNYTLAYIVSRYAALHDLQPKDNVFVEYPIYDFVLLCIFGDSAALMGRPQEAMEAYRLALRSKIMPEETRQAVENIINYNK